jgi:tetratricopeptide (TPR) repeat protein
MGMAATFKLSVAAGVLALALASVGCGSSPTRPSVSLPPPPEVDLSTLGEQPRMLVEEGLSRLEQYPLDAATNGHVGMLLHAFRRFEDAAKFYARARKIDPKAGRWSYYQGVALAERQEVAGAAEAFTTNLEQWQDHGPTKLRLARLYLEAAKLTESEALQVKGQEMLDGLVEDQPDYYPGLLEKGRRLAAAGDQAGAMDLFQRAIDGGYPGREAHEELAKIYELQGRETEAGRFEVLAENRPEYGLGDRKWMDRIAAMATTNLGFSERGEAMVKANMFAPATSEFERAVESGDNELDSRVNLIALYGIQGEIEKAERHYEMSIREGLVNGKLHLNMATIRLGQGRHAEAEEAYQRAIAIDPFLVKAYQGMSRSNLLKKNYPEAIRWAKRAVDREPTNAKVLAELARALRFNGGYSESVQYFKQAALYSEGIDQIQAMRSLASTQLDAKDYAGATETLNEAKQAASKAGNNVQALLIESQLGEVADAQSGKSAAVTP